MDHRAFKQKRWNYLILDEVYIWELQFSVSIVHSYLAQPASMRDVNLIVILDTAMGHCTVYIIYYTCCHAGVGHCDRSIEAIKLLLGCFWGF